MKSLWSLAGSPKNCLQEIRNNYDWSGDQSVFSLLVFFVSDEENIALCCGEDKNEQNKSRNSNILDERASLKVGLQVEQGNFPHGKDILTGYHVWRLGVKS